MKYLCDVIRDFLANLDRENMDVPAAIILTPKMFKRACAELHCGDVPAIELTGATGSVYLQAGIIQRVEGPPPLRAVPPEEP